MRGGRGNNEKNLARKRALNHKTSRKPPTTNSRIAHARDYSSCEFVMAGATNKNYLQ